MDSNSSVLILSLSPTDINKPYYFNATRKKIYSLEELFYHCYYFWKQSIDDFLSGTIEIWIEQELGLKYLSSKIQRIKDTQRSITDQYSAFLYLIDYFEDSEIAELKKEIYSWENMDQWKKYKEKADYYLECCEYIKAIELYKDALNINTDLAIINNLGLAYMKLGQFNKAMECFKQAQKMQFDNEMVILNIAEVYMLQQQYDMAYEILQRYDFLQNSPDALNVYGELECVRQNYDKAIEYFNRAHELGDSFMSLIKIAGIYSKQHKYRDTMSIMQKVSDKENSRYYYEYAMMEYEFGNVNEAIVKAEKALTYNKKSIDVWLLLVKLYKRNKNVESAQRALLKIFEIDPDNEMAKLEYASLKKSNGLIKDYQDILKSILSRWKQRYRNNN